MQGWYQLTGRSVGQPVGDGIPLQPGLIGQPVGAPIQLKTPYVSQPAAPPAQQAPDPGKVGQPAQAPTDPGYTGQPVGAAAPLDPSAGVPAPGVTGAERASACKDMVALLDEAGAKYSHDRTNFDDLKVADCSKFVQLALERAGQGDLSVARALRLD
jgi:cell wall-associated NlpC family hydrolase